MEYGDKLYEGLKDTDDGRSIDKSSSLQLHNCVEPSTSSLPHGRRLQCTGKVGLPIQSDDILMYVNRSPTLMDTTGANILSLALFNPLLFSECEKSTFMVYLLNARQYPKS